MQTQALLHQMQMHQDSKELTTSSRCTMSPDRLDECSPLDTQVGGSHYQIAIQPVEYIFHNNLNFLQGNVVKYITRYKDKNGKEDLEKVKHYVDLLIELEYGDESMV